MNVKIDHILIVDDDKDIRQLLKTYLEKHGLRATTVANGKGMFAELDRGHFDLIVLDLMLPGEDGLSLCRRLRANSNVAVIMLTALGEETDRIVGLEIGADDYVTKPFNPRELLARIKGVLRRLRSLPATDGDATPCGRLRFGDWLLDTRARHLVTADGVVVPLSGGEYRLLRIFLDHPNRVLSRDQILDLAKGKEALPFDRSIDVQVGRLRKRLDDDGREPKLIKTVRGEGYVFASTVTKEPSCD